MRRRRFLRAAGATVGAGVAFPPRSASAQSTAVAGAEAAPPTAWRRRYAANGSLSRFLTIVPVGEGYVLGGAAGGHDHLRGLVVRTDSRGRPRWQRTYGTVKSGVTAGASHPDGGVVLAGSANLDDSSPFTETPLSADPWLLRIDDGGDVVWARTLQPSAAAGQADALTAVDGGYLVAGRRRENRESGPRPWAAHVTAAGHRRWTITLGAEDEQGFLTAAAAVDGGWYVGGSTSPVDAGDDRLGEAETALLARLDSEGTVRWRRSPDGPRGSRIEDLNADASGVVAVGNRGFAVDDDGRGWHLRLGAEGDLAWETTHSSGPWNWLYGLASISGDGGDGDGGNDEGSLLVGTRERPPEGDDPNGPRGAWLLRTGPAGEVRWTTTYFDGDWSHGETVHALETGFLVAGSTDTGDDQAAWLLRAGDVPAADGERDLDATLDRVVSALPPTADDVGLGVLLGAGAATLARRLLDRRDA